MTDPSANTSATAPQAHLPNNSNPPPPANTILLEQHQINEEYKIWKTNSPYLYDFVMNHDLEWPSLTVQWLPDGASSGRDGDANTDNRLLLGTHTTDEQNYLMVASANLPVDEHEEDQEWARKKQKMTVDSTSNSGQDEIIGSINIQNKIPHLGEVHRARYMPQNPMVVASRGPDPEVYIWNLAMHPPFPKDDDHGENTPSPQGVCVGHVAEGYGMCWNTHKDGCLVTASHDANVCLWDVNVTVKETHAQHIQPLCTFRGHRDVVEDVDWHHEDANLFGSVGDDKTVRVWDTRTTKKATHCVEEAHMEDVHGIAFHPVNEFMFATGSGDKAVALWDLRNLKSRIQTLTGHTDHVYSIAWSPFNDSILASCSSDRRVAIWDLSRIGMEQTAEDAEDGPPELLFLHGGHTGKVLDLCWNDNEEHEWTIASVAEDNVLQVWTMADELLDDVEEEDEEEGVASYGGKGEENAAMLHDNELE